MGAREPKKDKDIKAEPGVSGGFDANLDAGVKADLNVDGGNKDNAPANDDASRAEAERIIAFLKQLQALSQQAEEKRVEFTNGGQDPGDIRNRYVDAAGASVGHAKLSGDDVVLLESAIRVAGASQSAKEDKEKALEEYLKTHEKSELEQVVGKLSTLIDTVTSIKGAYHG